MNFKVLSTSCGIKKVPQATRGLWDLPIMVRKWGRKTLRDPPYLLELLELLKLLLDWLELLELL